MRAVWDVDDDGERTGVLVVTLDRPDRRNAVDHATLLALADAQGLAADARVLVLSGEPPSFCAGADLTGVEDGEFATLLGKVLRGFTALPIPTVAAVDGAALGAGTQLVVACDLRVATPTSRFGIPAARLGLVVDHWTVERLGREFGWSIARAMLLGAETYSGEDAERLGFVQRVGDVRAALGWADEIAALAPLTLAGSKLALNRLEMPVGRGDDPDVGAAWAAAWASEDLQEGIAAFRERRRPVFPGR